MVAQVLAAPIAAAIQIIDSRNRTGTPSPPSSGRTPRKARPDTLSSERESLGSQSSASTSAAATPSASPQPPKRADTSPPPKTDFEPSTMSEIGPAKLVSPAASIETIDVSQIAQPPSNVEPPRTDFEPSTVSEFVPGRLVSPAASIAAVDESQKAKLPTDVELPMLAEAGIKQLTSSSSFVGEPSDENPATKRPRLESDVLSEQERRDILASSISVNETFKPSGAASQTLAIADSIVAVTAPHEIPPQSHEALVQKTANIEPHSQLYSGDVLVESKISIDEICVDGPSRSRPALDDNVLPGNETRDHVYDSDERIKSSSEPLQPEVSTLDSRVAANKPHGIPQSCDVQLQDSKQDRATGVINVEQQVSAFNLTDASSKSFEIEMNRPTTVLLDRSQPSDDFHSSLQEVSQDSLEPAGSIAEPAVAIGYPKPDSRNEVTPGNAVEPAPLIIFSPGTPAAKFETDRVVSSCQDNGSSGIAVEIKERMASKLLSQQPVSPKRDQLILDDRLPLFAVEPSNLAPISGQYDQGRGLTDSSPSVNGVADAVAQEALAPSHEKAPPVAGQPECAANRPMPDAASDEMAAENSLLEAAIKREADAASAFVEPTISEEISPYDASSSSIPSAETSEVKSESKLHANQMPQCPMPTVDSPKKDQITAFPEELQSDRYLFEKAEIQPQISAAELSSALQLETSSKMNGSTEVDSQRSPNANNDATPIPTIPGMAASKLFTDAATTTASPVAGQSQSPQAGGMHAEAIIPAAKMPREPTITATPSVISAANEQPILETESKERTKHEFNGESQVEAPVSEPIAVQPMPAPAAPVIPPCTDSAMGYESLQNQNETPASLAEASAARIPTPEECYMATTGKELAGEISIIRGFGVSKEPVLTPPDDSFHATDPAKSSQPNSLMGGLILSPAALLNYGVRKEAKQPSPPIPSETASRKTSQEATLGRPQSSPKQSPSKTAVHKSAEVTGPQQVAVQSEMKNLPQADGQSGHQKIISAAKVPEAGSPKEPSIEDVSAKATAGISQAQAGPLSSAAAFPNAMASLALKMRPGNSGSIPESASQVSRLEAAGPDESTPSHNSGADFIAAGDTIAVTKTTEELLQQQRDFSSDSLDVDSREHLTKRSPDELEERDGQLAASPASAPEVADINATQPTTQTESIPPSKLAPIVDVPSVQVSSRTFQTQGRDTHDDAVLIATAQLSNPQEPKDGLALTVHEPLSGTPQLPETPLEKTINQQKHSESFVQTANAPNFTGTAFDKAVYRDNLVIDTILQYEEEMPTAPLSSPLSLDSIAAIELQKTTLSEAGRTTPDSLIGSFDEMRASGMSGDSIDDASPPRASSNPERAKQLEPRTRPDSGPGPSAGSEGIPNSLQTSLERSVTGSSKSHRISGSRRFFGDIRPPSPAHSLPGDDAAGRSPGLIRRCLSAKARSQGQLGDDGLSAADKATQMVIRLEKYRSINARLKLQKSASADVPAADDNHVMAEAAEGVQETKKWAPPTSIATGAASQNGGCCGGGGFPPILIQGGMVVDCGMLQVADVYIDSGIIRHVGPVDVTALPSSVTIINAVGKYIFPGGIDISITSVDLQDNHSFNAGHFAKFTKQAVIDGSTFLVSLVSQLHDETLLEAFTRCQQLAEQHAYCNFTFMVLVKTWTASVRSEMSLLVKNYGVNAFVFATSNAPGFARMLPDNELLEALRHCNDLGATAIGYLDSSSDYAQLTTALNRFLTFAELSGAPVLIVPINDPRLMNSIRKFRQKGVKVMVSCNTSELAGSKLRPAQKMPYQNGHVQNANKVDYSGKKLNGTISSPTHLETGISSADGLAFDRFGAAPSLLSLMSCSAIDFMIGGGHTESAEEQSSSEGRLNLLWHEGFKSGQLDAMRIAAATSSELAKLFNLYPLKGSLAEGSDADLVIWDPSVPVPMATPVSPAANSKKMLSYLQAADQAPASPYCATILGGRIVAQNSKTMVKKKTGEFTPLKAGSPYVFRYSMQTEPGLLKAAQRDAILHQFDAFLVQKPDNVDRCHCHPPRQPPTALVKKRSLGTADQQPRKSEVDYDALRKNAGLF